MCLGISPVTYHATKIVPFHMSRGKNYDSPPIEKRRSRGELAGGAHKVFCNKLTIVFDTWVLLYRPQLRPYTKEIFSCIREGRTRAYKAKKGEAMGKRGRCIIYRFLQSYLPSEI